MVQEARLDLTRLVIALLLVSGAARAQPSAQPAPLLQERPLTTLLQPQKLDRSRPLLRPSGEGAGSTVPVTNLGTPCARQGAASGATSSAAKPSSTPSIFGGGSGPGDYGRYLPNTAAASSTASKAPGPAGASPAPASVTQPQRNAAVDRPFYSGTDRPLWDTGDRRPPANAAANPATGKPPQPSDTSQVNGAPSAGTAAAPPRDRPLWGDGSPMASADPSAGTGTAVTPCMDTVPTTPR